jgi:hypothetical protein
MNNVEKFIKYTEEELPKEYYTVLGEEGVTIKNNGRYIYMFYTQEIEDDLNLCCSLVHTLLDFDK